MTRAAPRRPAPSIMGGRMIPRYSRPELAALWTDEARMSAWRDVEVAACEAMEGPTASELDAIRAATFTVEAVNERERTTDHDVAAFVDVLSASAGPAGRWIHYGLTSSDVLDTALALQLKRAGEIVVPGAHALVAAFAARAREHRETLCVGRTHGVHAEPTSFGIKLAGFAFEAHRNAARLERAFAQASVGAISGAVGTYSATSPEFESRVLASLGPGARAGLDAGRRARPPRRAAAGDRAGRRRAGALRDRAAPPAAHGGARGGGAVPQPGRRAPAAMPHKRNPIKSEQLSGLARVLRGNAQAAVEDVALWHERDISHSSVERVILPDSTILIDYMQARATALVEGMVVHRARMQENLEITCGALFSQRVLLALIEQAGMVRDDAYRIVQRTAQEAWDTRTPLRSLLASSPRSSTPAWTSTRCSTTACTSATPTRSSRGWTRSPEASRARLRSAPVRGYDGGVSWWRQLHVKGPASVGPLSCEVLSVRSPPPARRMSTAPTLPHPAFLSARASTRVGLHGTLIPVGDPVAPRCFPEDDRHEHATVRAS